MMKQAFSLTKFPKVYRFLHTMAVLLGTWSLLTLFTACEKDTPEPISPVRTLLFYLGGDNNLSGEVSYKIEQIKATALSSSCRVVVYKDTRKEAPQLLELKKEHGQVQAIVVREYEESNSASAQTFTSVLQEVRELFPAASYGMIVFSHATGWLPQGAPDNPVSRSIIVDGSSQMEFTDFAATIPDGMFQFIVFEACHMAGVEVAWELKDKTQYIIASAAEIVSPGFAPAYPQALPYLFRQEVNLPKAIEAINADYATRQGDYASLTLSLIDCKALDSLADIIRNSPEISIRYTKGFSDSDIDKASIQFFDRTGNHLFFDLDNYFATLVQHEEAPAISRAIANIVSSKTSTASFMPGYGGFEVVSHCGLTTYIPQEKYPRLNECYKQLRWYKEVINHLKN